MLQRKYLKPVKPGKQIAIKQLGVRTGKAVQVRVIRRVKIPVTYVAPNTTK